MTTAMEDRIAAWLAHRMPAAGDFAVDDLRQIHGGSSQETFRLRARWREGGQQVERRLILRRNPAGSVVKADDGLEYSVYSALAGSGVPVPTVLFQELDEQWLGRAFFVMDLVPGKPGQFHMPDVYEGHDASIGHDFWQYLGRLASLDHRALGLTHLRNGEADGGYALRELAHWEAIYRRDETAVEPIIDGAIRWMRRNPPPEPVKRAIVHGDYRSGNFLFVPDGRISGILDWEMCHIGDPLEDIAWATDPLWTMERHLPLAEGLAIWEDASGISIDPDAFLWWRLFAAFKTSVLWTTFEHNFADGSNPDPMLPVTKARAGWLHRKEILKRLAELGGIG